MIIEAKVSTSEQQACGRAELPNGLRWTALTVVTTLFFMWGFITVLNDILMPHLKAVFVLNYFEVSLIQFTFFIAYFIMSLPAGKLVARFGYKGAMVIGLLTSALGALLFLPAASLFSYPVFLGACLIIATGFTILQVAANPYIAALGRPETASSRLNLAQAFNSLGTTLAPWLGGLLILSHVPQVANTDRVAEAASVRIPYLCLAGILLLLAMGFYLFKLPSLSSVEEDHQHPGTFTEVFRIPHLTLGAIGIFLYVGAEVSIGSFLINFMGAPEIAGLDPISASRWVVFYWGGAMVGRFLGSVLLQKVESSRLLAFNAAIAAMLSVIGLLASGHLSMLAVIAIGFFNSIMFPNIFALGIRDLGRLTGLGSSILIMAILGAAVIPVVMGRMADLVGVHHALFIPALCYLYIIYYGISGCRIDNAKAASAASSPEALN